MKIIQIKAGRQSNGLWGTPMNLVGMDRAIYLPPKNEELRSAIITAIAERYPKSLFEVLFSTDIGFTIKAIDCEVNGHGLLGFLYNSYHLDGNTLYCLENDKDVRNLKLKLLSENNI